VKGLDDALAVLAQRAAHPVAGPAGLVGDLGRPELLRLGPADLADRRLRDVERFFDAAADMDGTVTAASDTSA
jgi:hypothetical protein